jgi:beta-fructofuranosidase
LSPGDERREALARAEASVASAAAKLVLDANRPTFHVMPPANWLNDPNGPLVYKGWNHLFFQHHPYGDQWGSMHWGHVRSRDLVFWERLPIALWPSQDLGEDHVFSGSAILTAAGKPMLFYTSIGPRLPEQWAAVPEDDELRVWRKHPANPMLTEKLHGSTKIHEWRDPFCFTAAGKTWIVCGGNLNGSKGGAAAVQLYEATNSDLTAWKYRGMLFQHPDKEVMNIECPLFFPLQDRWVLVVSAYRNPEYFVGRFDPAAGKFAFKTRGVFDPGNFYAPSCMADADGRRVLWGWINGFPAGRGWNGCLTLPRLLSINEQGALRQTPLPELTKLRTHHVDVTPQALDGDLPLNISGAALEVAVELDRGDARSVGLAIRRSSDGKRAVAISWDGSTLDVAGTKSPLPLAKDVKTLKLDVFIDGMVVEVYAQGRAVTRVVDAKPADAGVAVFSDGGRAAIVSAKAWNLQTIWQSSPRP